MEPKAECIGEMSRSDRGGGEIALRIVLRREAAILSQRGQRIKIVILLLDEQRAALLVEPLGQAIGDGQHDALVGTEHGEISSMLPVAWRFRQAP